VIEHVKVLGELALMDAIWSIGVRYAGVVNVINRYRGTRRRDGADPDADTPQELVAFVEVIGGPEAFAEAVDNRQRTSSRSGILKAEAVLLAAQALVYADVETPQDLAQATPERLAELRSRWTAITGQASGLSWEYFLMLSGLQGVKADRMVRRFVADALGVAEQAVSQRDGHALVTEAAKRLDVEVSQLDYAVWLRQSGNKPT
jgi:hypothetical protein